MDEIAYYPLLNNPKDAIFDYPEEGAVEDSEEILNNKQGRLAAKLGLMIGCSYLYKLCDRLERGG